MSEKLRILNLEDNPNDSELVRTALEEYGIDCDFVRVQTREDYLSALSSGNFDLILADYSLPGFDGMSALELLREVNDLPFVFVSGEIGEDLAIRALKKGATDYVLKNRLDKLGPSVKRAVREAKERADRMAADAALRQSETRYRTLVEDVRDIIFTLASDGVFVSLSPAFETITGWPPGEWVGKHFSSLVHPDEVPYAVDLFGRIIKGATLPLFELRGRTRSGEYRHFEFKITSGRADQGMVLGIARDITQRKLAEEERARLVSAVEAAAEAIVITSPSSGAIQYVNPAFEQMTGYTKEEALGRTLHFLESGKQGDEYYAGLREKLKTDDVWSGKLTNKRKDGTQYFEECTVSPVRNRNGEIINYVYLKRDVTEKLRLESVAEAANTMQNIGYVFSGISHEIGNPVSALMVTLDLLKAKLDTSPKETIAEYADRAMSQVSKIEYLLHSLKNFNMFEIQELQNVQTAVFMDQFLALVSEDFAKKGITIEYIPCPEADRIYADPRAFQQIMLNIFTNAADALENRPDPKIVVRVSKSADTIRIRVEDNGCGMTKEQQAKLFQPFFTTKSHGTGLGMVIIKNMLTTMKGTIEIESRVNTGTSIHLVIPGGDNGKQ